MKHTTTFLWAFAIAVALSVPLQAQSLNHPLQNRSSAWWTQLELQLENSLTQPVEQIQDETLQHIIFFATNYKDKVNLDNLTPRLLALYEQKANEARRTMALVALHAIGEKMSMKRLAELVEDEPAGSIRNITMAVLADYYTSG